MGWSMTVVRYGNNKRDSIVDVNDHKIIVKKGKRNAFSSRDFLFENREKWRVLIIGKQPNMKYSERVHKYLLQQKYKQIPTTHIRN